MNATASPADPDCRPRVAPPRAGIGLRAAHYREVLARRPDVGWLEVHSENYFGGGAPLVWLERIREHYALSLHGVGLSLGSTDRLSRVHLDRLAALIARLEPALVSDHLCWCSVDGVYFNDLLPLPYTEEALGHVAARIVEVQDRLARRILVENVSSYLRFVHSTIPEWEFVAEVARRTGCGILLDVNNVHVSAANLGFDAHRYIDAVPVDAVEEIHLAGHARNRHDGGEVLIDDHGAPVAAPVWRLFERALSRLGPTPTLVEWDSNLPALDVLVAEARRADRLAEHCRARAA